MNQHAVSIKLVKTLHSHCFNPINHVWMIVDAMHLLFLQAAPEKENIHDHNQRATEQINAFFRM